MEKLYIYLYQVIVGDEVHLTLLLSGLDRLTNFDGRIGIDLNQIRSNVFTK